MDNSSLKNLLKILSKMDKKDIEKGLEKAKQVLNNNDSSEIINNLKEKEGKN